MEDNYCRLCMGEDSLRGMDVNVLDCVKNLFSFEINVDDVLSKEICDICLEFISKLIVFKQKVDKVQKLLQKIVKRKEPYHTDGANNQTVAHVMNDLPVMVETHPKPPPKTRNVNTVEDLTDINDILLSNNDLISSAVRSINLEEVERNVQNMSNPNNFCKTCKRKYESSEKLAIHMNLPKHNFRARIIEKTGNPDIFSTHVIAYACPNCEKKFTTKSTLVDHLRNIHQVAANARKIGPNAIISKKKKDVDDNDVEKNDDEGIRVKIEPGNFEINSIDKLKEHGCKICNKSFGFVESLHRHIQKHHKGVHFCVHCQFTTINRQTFITHLRKHYNLSYLHRMCSICFKVCNSYSELSTHRKEAHVAKIQPVCTICNKSFSSSTLLKRHKRDVHRTGVEAPKKLLTCRKCNRSFLSLLVLEKHQCTAVRWTCFKMCGKRFDSYSGMQRHSVKCNSGKTIYFCKICKRSLKSLSGFKIHVSKCSSKSNEPPRNSEKRLKYDDKVEIGIAGKRKIDANQNMKNDQMKTVQKKYGTASIKNQKLKRNFKLKKIAKKMAKKMAKKQVKRERKRKTQKTTVEKCQDPNDKKNMVVCKKCGLVFKHQTLLWWHELSIHSAKSDLVYSIPSNKKIQQNEQSAKRDNATPSSGIKWKNSQLPEVDQNVIKVCHAENAPKSIESPIQPSFKKIDQNINLSAEASIPVTPQKRNDLIDRAVPRHYSTSNRISSGKLEKRNRWDCSYEKPPSTKIDDGIPMKTKKPFKPVLQTGHHYKTQIIIPPVNTTSTPKVSQRNDQLTTTQQSSSTCVICRKSKTHFFCNPCRRCFILNQVQYNNHMKMKHSYFH